MKKLKALMQASSVAVIGASTKPGALGHRVVANLHHAGFSGPVLPVHPKHASVQRIHCYRSVQDMPFVPELAIVCTPAAQIADQMIKLGEKGTRAAIVCAHDPDGELEGTPLKQAIEAAAARYGMRWIGPRSAGLQLPRTGLNASWMEFMPPAGKLALVSQSSSLAASVVAWAVKREIGFSSVVTLGDGGNVDASDLLDYLAADGRTQAILLCLRTIGDGRKFIASARAVARQKPVVVLWADSPAQQDAGDEPTVDHNYVCKAAFRRSGLLRVDELGEWFDAVEMLGYGRRHIGDKLAIVSNGIGPALLAQAMLSQRHSLAELDATATAALAPLLPGGIAAANPLNLGVDAGASRYEAAMSALLTSGAADALLAIVTPCKSNAGVEIAHAIAKVARSSGRTVMVCWLGGSIDAKIHAILAAAEVSLFDTPELAANAYLHMVRFRRGQESLKQLPEPCSFKSSSAAHDLNLSDDAESAEYLRAYGAISEAILNDEAVVTGSQAVAVLAAVGLRGGVSPIERAQSGADALIPLRITVGTDAAFGRAIEAAVGSQKWTLLPALNTDLTSGPARSLRNELNLLGMVEFSSAILARVLFQIADLLVGFPEITGMKIPGFEWDGTDLKPRDTRIWVRTFERGQAHLAIHPYPRETEEQIVLRDGRSALLRPVRPAEDIPLLDELLANVVDDDKYLRFCKVVKGVPPDLLAKLARVDYDREMVFIALSANSAGNPVALGVVDAFVSPDHSEAEYSILLRSDMKGTGLGKALMQKIIAYCKGREIHSIIGLVLKENAGMRGLAKHLGFSTRSDPDDDMVTMTLDLKSKEAAA